MKMKEPRLLAGFFVGLMLMTTSCKHDPEGLAELDKVYYDTEIQTIMNAKCTMCHGLDKTEADVDLTTYEGVKKIVEGSDPTKSKLYQVITAQGAVLMPPRDEAPMSKNQRNTIYTWILQSAPQTNPTEGK